MRHTYTATDAKDFVSVLKQKGQPLQSVTDLDEWISHIAQKKVVMLGEASHGTHEYYTWRSYITRKLLAEHGFNFVAVEGDWPDCYRVNRFIKQKQGAGASALQVLWQFDRWPTWMWANWEMVALTEWMQHHNASLDEKNKQGFYGLDVYSLWDSLMAVKDYLQKTDAAALQQAEKAFRCFAPYRDDETSYAHASQLVPKLCEDEVARLLHQMRQHALERQNAEEQVFSAEQNALVAVNAEKYYRAMIQGGPGSWNVRDSHMAETLFRLLDFHGPQAKAIVWEHNTHIGDASATSMADEGMYNIGELVRAKFAEDDVALVGFGSYSGTVMAAGSWGADQKIMEVPEAKEDSLEWLMHQAGGNRLLLSETLDGTAFENTRIGHRAIGVVYRPHYERWGNYVPTVLSKRYDAFIYLDQTRALHPLHGEPHNQKMPDTYPFGM